MPGQFFCAAVNAHGTAPWVEHIRPDFGKSRRMGTVRQERASDVGFVRGFRTDHREAYVFFRTDGSFYTTMYLPGYPRAGVK